ncbi:MAG: T9SS type A sorting domain-containing protein [Candidatus Cloacimonetes bacterium]|nr:T9SS type A sorting domain-containing protein [Candidatus Cloacimonadota bacterium]
MNTWWGTQNPDEIYFICTFDWSDIGWSMPFATEIDDYYWDFGNGYVPFFIVIGANNILMYGSNYYQQALNMVPEAIASFDQTLPPENLAVDEGTGLFTWDAPVSRVLTGYDIYLDSIFLENITDTEFQFEDLVNEQTYLAGVSAVYDEGTSEIIEIDFTYTGTGAGNDIVPSTDLIGNYPNPFNPTTTISFSVAQTSSFVNLDIYNLKGQKIKTLVNEKIGAGIHQIVWNGDDEEKKPVSSGVYFYKIKAGTYTSTKKMILLK